MLVHVASMILLEDHQDYLQGIQKNYQLQSSHPLESTQEDL